MYLALAYLGASSVSLGMGANGGIILTNVVNHLFGSYGTLLLGIAITAACLTTSVGIVAACGDSLPYYQSFLIKSRFHFLCISIYGSKSWVNSVKCISITNLNRYLSNWNRTYRIITC